MCQQLFCVRVKFSLAEHCLKWAGKPRILSPLMCARYGWINVGCDMLKCTSCQAFLCASLQPTLDFEKCKPNFKQQKKTMSEPGHTLCWQSQTDVASLPKIKGQATLFFLIDESRIAEISRQLQTQHEKFCPWPDFPCPGKSNHLWRVYTYITKIVFNMTVSSDLN